MINFLKNLFNREYVTFEFIGEDGKKIPKGISIDIVVTRETHEPEYSIIKNVMGARNDAEGFITDEKITYDFRYHSNYPSLAELLRDDVRLLRLDNKRRRPVRVTFGRDIPQEQIDEVKKLFESYATNARVKVEFI